MVCSVLAFSKGSLLRFIALKLQSRILLLATFKQKSFGVIFQMIKNFDIHEMIECAICGMLTFFAKWCTIREVIKSFGWQRFASINMGVRFMQKVLKFVFAVLFFTCSFFLVAGERTIPVDIFLMIDKSLSMDEPGKFDSLQKWVLDELIEQMIIPGDWVTIYQFYEKPEHILTTTVEDATSRRKIYNTVKAIKADGHYTDIGAALDTVQAALDARGSNGRFKVLLLLSDLVQDAPWTSKYRGKQASFKSPFLVEARTVQHDNWYEITLDMDIQDAVVQRTQSLYSDVVANEGLPRTESDQDKALIQGSTTVVTNTSSGSANGGTNDGGQTASTSATGVSSNGGENGSPNGGGQTASTSATGVSSNGGENGSPNDGVQTASTGTTGVSSNGGENGSPNDGGQTASTGTTGVSSNGGENGSPNDGGQTASTSATGVSSNGGENGSPNGGVQTASTSATGVSSNGGTNDSNINDAANSSADGVASGKSNSSVGSEFFKNYGVPILIGLGILLVIILLIILIAHTVNESRRRKEARKEKINLV